MIPSFVCNGIRRFLRLLPSPTSSVFRPHGLAGCAWPIGHARPKNLLVAHATNWFTHGRVGRVKDRQCPLRILTGWTSLKALAWERQSLPCTETGCATMAHWFERVPARDLLGFLISGSSTRPLTPSSGHPPFAPVPRLWRGRAGEQGRGFFQGLRNRPSSLIRPDEFKIG